MIIESIEWFKRSRATSLSTIQLVNFDQETVSIFLSTLSSLAAGMIDLEVAYFDASETRENSVVHDDSFVVHTPEPLPLQRNISIASSFDEPEYEYSDDEDDAIRITPKDMLFTDIEEVRLC